MNSTTSSPSRPERGKDSRLPWSRIDTVFLDMDGTLLDRAFDDYFWEHHVPEVFARENGLDLEEARRMLLASYQSVASTLQWSDLDYWSQRLELDFTRLKEDIGHMVAVLPGVVELLLFLHRLGKDVFLVTNAHPETLRIKMAHSGLASWFHRRICSHEVGAAKEQSLFWQRLDHFLPHRKERTLLIDDSEKVLSAAAAHGIGHLLHIAKPSSHLPATPSHHFPSILSFAELLDDPLPKSGDNL
jgi:putative hydrolase of the HAD superfamily